jgi:proteasome lid subunit RPN8/RPN11
MNSESPTLLISEMMMDKVNYFLKTFKSLEWSGPAWYSHEKDENGFPTKVKLEYWHPLHLGTSSSTDWEGKDLMKIYKGLKKEFPKMGKEWVQGNIHSHHNMGAFFSGTDQEQLIDGANKHFYYSLVVSTKPGKELAFAVSYPDQFNKVHMIEIDDIKVEHSKVKNKEWEKQAASIKKKQKKLPAVYSYKAWGGQTGLFGIEDIQDPDGEMDDWNQSFNPKLMEYDDIMLDFERGRINLKKRNKQLKKLGVDIHGQPLP